MTLLAAILAASCIAVGGESITAADAARAVPAFGALAPAEKLAFAPFPGVRRVATAREIERWAADRGIAASPVGAVCFERRTEPLTAARILAALRGVFGDPAVRIEIIEFSHYAVPPGELEFPRAGLVAARSSSADTVLFWRGRLRYDGSRTMPVWARVKLKAAAERLIAAVDLAPGKPVRAEQVRAEKGDVCPVGEAPLQAPAQASGRVPKRTIRAGTPILAGDLAILRDVEAGGTVQVEVVSGAARLAFPGTAESAGSAGDAVLVRNPESGRSFRARVQGPGKVKVDAMEGVDGGVAAGSAGGDGGQ